MKTSKSLSIILALVLTFTLLLPGIPVLADDAPTLKTYIEGFDPVNGGAATGQLKASVSGKTVTVTGTVANATDTLLLDITSGVTVIWKANYSSTIMSAPLIELSGSGTFNVAAGGKVENGADTSLTIAYGVISGSANIIVSGGTVSSTGADSVAILSDSGNVTVTGGTVSNTGAESSAIFSVSGNVTVTGGTVSSTGTSSAAILSVSGNVTVTGGTVSADIIAIQAANGNVTVSGSGKVRATGQSSTAIATNFGDVTVSGGTVGATGQGSAAIVTGGVLKVTGGKIEATGQGGAAIVNSGGDVIITGGTVRATGTGGWAILVYDYGVAAYLKGKCTGTFEVNNNKGMIVEVDRLNIPASRHGTGDGLTEKPAINTVGNTAVWDIPANAPVGGGSVNPLIVFDLSGGPSAREIEWVGAPNVNTTDTTEDRVSGWVSSNASDDGWVTGEREVKTGIDYTAGEDIAPSSNWLEQNPAGKLAEDAKAGKQDYARTRNTGAYGVRGNAWQELKGLRYEHDTIVDGVVEVRFYTDSPEKLTKDIMVSGRVTGPDVEWAKGHFETWFKNKVRVIHLDQKGDFGQPVEIAARVDLGGMDTNNLRFYAYDKDTNTYREIKNPAYRIGENGYLYFTTEYAGDIIITDKPLERK